MTDKLREERELSPQFATMNGRDKWETLVLSGLIGTDEPWIEALTNTLREEASERDKLARLDEGECELCGKPLLHGQFVNLYDDLGTAHADCECPFAAPSEPTPTSDDDGSTMTTYVLLGVPALLVDLDTQDVRETPRAQEHP